MGRAPCCDKANVKKGPWSPEEDSKLKSYIEQNGTGGNWIALPQKIGLKRCGKSCRLRWLNYLRPNLKHGSFSEEEDKIICSLYITIGSRWSIIAAQLPGRTDNDIKNYWNTKLKKKLFGKPRKDSPNSNCLNPKQPSNPKKSEQAEVVPISKDLHWPQYPSLNIASDHHLNIYAQSTNNSSLMVSSSQPGHLNEPLGGQLCGFSENLDDIFSCNNQVKLERYDSDSFCAETAMFGEISGLLAVPHEPHLNWSSGNTVNTLMYQSTTMPSSFQGSMHQSLYQEQMHLGII